MFYTAKKRVTKIIKPLVAVLAAAVLCGVASAFTVDADMPAGNVIVEKIDGDLVELKVRIPGWARGRPVPSDFYVQTVPSSAFDVSLSVNGERVATKFGDDGYVTIDREWTVGDKTFPALKASDRFVLMPYFFWGNREPGNELQTWFSLDAQ